MTAMGTGQRRATRGVQLAAVAALALPAVTVAWLGALLLRSDRELDRQRMHERRETAAALVVGTLERSLTATDQLLARLLSAESSKRDEVAATFPLAPEDGALVVFEGGSTWSSTPLAWYPGVPFPDDAELSVAFVDAERVEFRLQDLAAAAATYRVLARSAERDVRAGALARLARVARKRDQPAVALAAYDALAALGDTTALGRPADLLAATETLVILDATGDTRRLGAEARAVLESLLRGRWRLSQSQFEFYRGRVEPLAGGATAADERARARLAVAEGVMLATRASVEPDSGVEGGRVPWNNAHSRGVVVWRRAGARVAALVATRGWVQREWLDQVRAVARGQRARVSLKTSDGAEWLDDALQGPVLRHAASDTGLPFAVRVASEDAAGDASTFAGRRRLLGGMVAALGLLMLGSGYVAARGIAREVAAVRLQSDFVAAVSHEFRTPVASVRQLSELLDDGRVVDEAKRQQYYGRIRRQAVRLQHLVENLLDFGRMEADAAEYRMTTLDAAGLVREVTREFQGDGRGSGRQVDVVVRDPLPPVVGDREALARALWNLLDNAAKYSPVDTAIVVDASASGDGVAIRVRDDGPGIPLHEQARIFDKFVRGAHARESGAKGTGLGLAMVRHILRAHRGDVELESQPGSGATFTIRIPAATVAPARHAVASIVDPA